VRFLTDEGHTSFTPWHRVFAWFPRKITQNEETNQATWVWWEYYEEQRTVNGDYEKIERRMAEGHPIFTMEYHDCDVRGG
jgi:hypothetical protein